MPLGSSEERAHAAGRESARSEGRANWSEFEKNSIMC